MRKVQKDSIVEIANLLKKAQEHIRILLKKQEYASVLDLLQQCQQGAIQIGTIIEQSEGEGFSTVKMLEEYCELVFQVFAMVQNNAEADADVVFGAMDRLLADVTESISKDIAVRKEVVFLPYKASMWDSLESIWMAADADPECDAYVVPIPYYEKDPEGNLKVYHYEGDDFPEYVKITHYNDYLLEEIHPDAVFIHNPYDHGNYVTSVHPRFYSFELKKYTDMLVYVPYYSTSGGMGEGQSLCSAYLHADYMVVQADKYKNFIDPEIPREKILPFGSPKFDRVLGLCNNPPQPPKAWEEKMRGKKVYFYNTSINGMLGDTRRFLMKMDYVFKCFANREDACLLWRPHPLLESTFDSMRKPYRPIYDSLKRYFMQNNLGIYDDTPDMEKTIALCDAYIGDSATSVVSLFGLAGKEIFILNNNIHSLPQEDDWRGEIIKPYFPGSFDRWRVTQGNKLYYSPNDDYHYEFYCDLSDYSGGDYYRQVIEVGGKAYVCPQNAQDILVVEDRKVVKKIALEKKIERSGAFADAWLIGNYIFLIPVFYPSIVRYDIINDKVDYIDGWNDFFIQTVEGDRRQGGQCIWNNFLIITSPVDDKVLAIDAETMQVQVLTTGAGTDGGGHFMATDGDEIWITPFAGTKVICWNPSLGTRKEYSDVPDGFVCKQRPIGFDCNVRPFGRVASYGRYAVLAPYWGNKFLRIDKETGICEEWKPDMNMSEKPENGYYTSWYSAIFVRRVEGPVFLLYSDVQKRLYNVNIESGACEEVQISFEAEDIQRNVAGFSEFSEWLQYAGTENSFNTLSQFLDGSVNGQAHDSERQKKAFAKVAANGDGTAGEKIYAYIKTKM